MWHIDFKRVTNKINRIFASLLLARPETSLIFGKQRTANIILSLMLANVTLATDR